MSTPKRLGVVMDPIGAINYAKDSTLAMLLAAQEHGFELAYLEQRDLLAARRRGARAHAPAHACGRTRPAGSRSARPPVTPLSALDCLLMRKDPPFDTEYIYSTYILERAETAGVLVVNRPQGLRDINEKVYAAWFPQCCAPTLITRDMGEMAAFLAEHGKIVVKPLHGMGGRSIFVLVKGDRNARVVFETLTDYGQRFAMAQRYIPEIAESGDSRVLLIDGEPLPYALARIPSPDDHRGNLAAGARGVGRPLNERDRWLAGQIGPALAAKGMLFVGLDVIGGFVTEINVTSPTGIRELDKQFGISIGERVIAALERRLKAAAAGARARSAAAPARPERLTPLAWHAARSCCGRARPRSGTACSPCCSSPGSCTGSSFSGSPSMPTAGDKGGAPGLEVLLVSDELPESDQQSRPRPTSRSARSSARATRAIRWPRTTAPRSCRAEARGRPRGRFARRQRRARRQPGGARAHHLAWSTNVRYLADCRSPRRPPRAAPAARSAAGRRPRAARMNRGRRSCAGRSAMSCGSPPIRARRRSRLTSMPGDIRSSASERSTTRPPRVPQRTDPQSCGGSGHRRQWHARQGRDPPLERQP